MILNKYKRLLCCVMVYIGVFLSVDTVWAEKLISTHGLSLFDRLKYDADFTHFDYVNPDAPKKGRIILSSIGGFDSFNGYNGKGEAAPGLTIMHDKLLQKAYDEPGSEYGLIAKKVTYPDDFSWVAYELRTEAKFSDGTPITADDVIFSFNILQEKGAPLYRYYYKNITNVEKLTLHKVKFTFNIQGNRELPLITGQIPILSKHYWEKQDFSKVSLDIPVVSGQYVIDKFEPNRNITYRRNPDYWAKDSAIRKGTGNFDTIQYELYRDALVAFEAFKAGEFDYHRETSAKNWATGYNFAAFKEGKVKKQLFEDLSPKPFQALVFNLRRSVFQDRALRQALNLIYDFEWLNKNLFYGAYTQTDSFFEGSEMEAIGKPSLKELEIISEFKELLPEEVINADINKQECVEYRQCSRLARKLLIKAGYKFNQGKLYTPDNKIVSFEILNASPLMERVLLPMVQRMKKLGVQVFVRTLDSAQYIRRLNNFDYDMIVSVWAQSPSPGNEQREYWSSQAADRMASRNYAGFKNPVVDKLIERLILAKNREDLVASVKVLDRLLRYAQFTIPLWHASHDRIAHWDKFSMPPKGETYGADGNILYWWIK